MADEHTDDVGFVQWLNVVVWIVCPIYVHVICLCNIPCQVQLFNVTARVQQLIFSCDNIYICSFGNTCMHIYFNIGMLWVV